MINETFDGILNVGLSSLTDHRLVKFSYATEINGTIKKCSVHIFVFLSSGI